jgi:DNA-binding transcriptional MerR regulator
LAGLPEIPVKLYYRIGEVADLVGVERHTLRYWESEFGSIRPQKSRRGQRIYSRRDVQKLLKVKDLLHNQGFTIAGARKRMRELGEEPSPAQDAARATVQRVRASLLAIREEIAAELQQLNETLD